MSNPEFDALSQTLLGRRFFETLLPGGKQTGKWWRCGDISGGDGGSFIFNTETGYWEEKSDGTWGSDIISLYAEQNNISQGEAFKRLSDTAGFQASSFTPIKKIPKPAIVRPDLFDGVDLKPSDFNLYGTPNYIHIYPDPSGAKTLMVVARHELGNGKKNFYPWTYINGQWTDKGHPNPRPIYGLDLLAKFPDKNVLIVEGELCADAAREVMSHLYVVVTWSGGAGAVLSTDWAPVRGRKVLLWPDRDRHVVKNQRQADKLQLNIGDEIPYAEQPGSRAMFRLSEKLLSDGVETLKLLNVSKEEDGFDARVAIKEKLWDYKAISEWAGSIVNPIYAPLSTVAEEPPMPTLEDDPAMPVGEVPDYDSNLPVPVSASMAAFLPDKTQKGIIRSTIENLEVILKMSRIGVRYNVIKKTEELLIPGINFSVDNRANASLAYVTSCAARLGMPLGNIGDYLTFLSDQNLYNPIATWITSKPWDGTSRIQQLYDTIISLKDDDDNSVINMKERLMYRWLVSAVAGCFEPNGVVARGVLVFQGAQNLGKTAWFKRLVPAELEAIADGMILRPDDKDSVKQICSYWLVELGELDATFKKSDIAQLKAFLTKQRDKLRAAFSKRESEYARRTIFFASVNPDQFLNDDTGNSRYWTVRCNKIDYTHTIDMQQLWAEVYEQHYKLGASWFLDKEEMDLLNSSNQNFMNSDVVEENLSHLDWWFFNSEKPETYEYALTIDVLRRSGMEKVTNSDMKKAVAYMLRRNGNMKKKTNGHWKYAVPRGVTPPR